MAQSHGRAESAEQRRGLAACLLGLCQDSWRGLSASWLRPWLSRPRLSLSAISLSLSPSLFAKKTKIILRNTMICVYSSGCSCRRCVGGVCRLSWPSRLPASCQERAQSFRSRLCLEEASGSLGDLGTLIPLLAACAKLGTIRMGPAIFWMGIFNVVSALQWDIPMPVQPMKSIAAVAIADGMTPGAFAAAGILVGGIMMVPRAAPRSLSAVCLAASVADSRSRIPCNTTSAHLKTGRAF